MNGHKPAQVRGRGAGIVAIELATPTGEEKNRVWKDHLQEKMPKELEEQQQLAGGKHEMLRGGILSPSETLRVKIG